MNKKRLLLVCLCLIMVLTAFSACGDNDEADDVSEKPSYVIGLSLEGLDHSYMITLRDQVLAAAEEYEDADVSVIVTDGQNSVVEQANGIEDMLTRGIDLLMIQASTSEGLMEAIASVEEKGIPYMFVGKPASGTNATTMVNNDNYEIGKNVGDWIVEYLTDKNGEPKGNVAHLSGIPGDQSSEDRTNGFLEAIKDYPDIKVVANVAGEYRRDAGLNAMQDVLQANPTGAIDVLYAANGESAIGASQAVSDAARTGEFPILSVDGDVASIEEIKAGNLTVAWTYEPCGTSGFEYAIKILNGEKVDPQIIIPSRVIDASNAETAIPAF
ncbi:MAG: substrate-binding domain-containing protein [Parabacteroides sp.]|nr:substrate-binding domain-containing protein [Parabacteroides sp.]